MGKEAGVWPSEVVLASYDDKDVLAYLETFVGALTALAELNEQSLVHMGAVPLLPVEGGWVDSLPAQLEDAADVGRAFVAYVQLIGSFELFAKPFEEFLRRAAELEAIPSVDIAFDAWVLRCITLCLTQSRIGTMRRLGCSSWEYICKGSTCSKVVAKLLLDGYRSRVAKDLA